jgi:hypothetical protein
MSSATAQAGVELHAPAARGSRCSPHVEPEHEDIGRSALSPMGPSTLPGRYDLYLEILTRTRKRNQFTV